jgi:hypothetical protein
MTTGDGDMGTVVDANGWSGACVALGAISLTELGLIELAFPNKKLEVLSIIWA